MIDHPTLLKKYMARVYVEEATTFVEMAPPNYFTEEEKAELRRIEWDLRHNE